MTLALTTANVNSRRARMGWQGRGGLGGFQGKMEVAMTRCSTASSEPPLSGDADSGSIHSKRQQPPLPTRRKKVRDGGYIDDYDLLALPGVGPKNHKRLVTNGLRTVTCLQEALSRDCGGEYDTFKDYLSNDIGIYKNYSSQIAEFVVEVDEEERKIKEKRPAGDKITFCIEGNISVGKTTFLKKVIGESVLLKDMVEIVPEPVDQWQHISYPEGIEGATKEEKEFNLLDKFYKDPKRWGYTFQNYVFMTRMLQHQSTQNSSMPLRLLERSVFSDRMVFVRSLHHAKYIDEMELKIYESWFDPMVSTVPGLVPDAFIYLRAQPETCFGRKVGRSRVEEAGVNINYLQDLHEKHESWLYNAATPEFAQSLKIEGVDGESKLHDSIKDNVFMLGRNCPTELRNIPALVLECDDHIDMTLDRYAKEELSTKVHKFFEFMQTQQKKQLDTDILRTDMSNIRMPTMEDRRRLMNFGGRLA